MRLNGGEEGFHVFGTEERFLLLLLLRGVHVVERIPLQFLILYGPVEEGPEVTESIVLRGA